MFRSEYNSKESFPQENQYKAVRPGDGLVSFCIEFPLEKIKVFEKHYFFKECDEKCRRLHFSITFCQLHKTKRPLFFS